MGSASDKATDANIPTPTPLFVEDLLAAATSATGLEDYGDRGFIKGLTILTEALRSEANLNAMGQVIQSGGIIRLLSNRLRYVHDVKLHPEIRDEKIDAPIVVLGLPRTGTSKLQRVMSADPAVQRLEVWRLLNPAPFPGEEPGNPKERIEVGLMVEQMFTTQFPGWMVRHPMEAREPDEELFIMEMSFECAVTAMLARMPTFRKFATQCDPHPTYKILHEMMQYLQWQDGGARGRPFIMKSPVHIGDLPTFFEFFPNATVVHCHRDPRKIVPSFASLIVEGRRMSSDVLDPVEIAQEWFDYWADLIDRNLVARDTLPKDLVDRIVDVEFDDIRKDPVSVVRKVYERAGRKVTPEAVAAFKDYDARRPEKHWGAYEYTTEEFQLSEAAIDKRFEEYRKRFITTAK